MCLHITCLPSGRALAWCKGEDKVISVLKLFALAVYEGSGAVHIFNRGSRLDQGAPVRVRRNIVKGFRVKSCNK